MNFRHGDHQFLIGSYLYSTDTMYEYGGAFLWGSGHVVANNYFSFARTLAGRGNAAVYLNAGIDESDHASSFSNTFARNIFADNNGYDVDCEGLLDRRITWAADRGETVAVTRGNRWLNNIFRRDPAFSSFQVFRREQSNEADDTFSGNIASNANQVLPAGFVLQDPLLVENEFGIKLPADPMLTALGPGQLEIGNIAGIDINLNELVNRELSGEPLGFDEVGPSWLTEKPGTYAETGVLAPAVQARLDAITQ
jgi:chondroitin B lyase